MKIFIYLLVFHTFFLGEMSIQAFAYLKSWIVWGFLLLSLRVLYVLDFNPLYF